MDAIEAAQLIQALTPSGGVYPDIDPEVRQVNVRALWDHLAEDPTAYVPRWLKSEMLLGKSVVRFSDLVKAARAKKGKKDKKPNGKAQALHGAMDRLPEGTKIEANGGSYQKQGKGWQDHQGEDVSASDAMGKLQEDHGDDHLWDSLKDHAGGDSTTWTIPPAPGKDGKASSAAEKKATALAAKLQAKRRELEAHKQARVHEAELSLVEKQLAAHKGAK